MLTGGLLSLCNPIVCPSHVYIGLTFIDNNEMWGEVCREMGGKDTRIINTTDTVNKHMNWIKDAIQSFDGSQVNVAAAQVRVSLCLNTFISLKSKSLSPFALTTFISLKFYPPCR